MAQPLQILPAFNATRENCFLSSEVAEVTHKLRGYPEINTISTLSRQESVRPSHGEQEVWDVTRKDVTTVRFRFLFECCSGGVRGKSSFLCLLHCFLFLTLLHAYFTA